MRGAPKLGLKPYGAIGALLTTQNQENLDIDRRVPVSVRKEKPSWYAYEDSLRARR
ncbi:hypothetical protein EYZ11_013104 [Aspergillus tanneri]|uniref:Uncharacterized protein n=1 Tax=Aspergillus tanneri TaxID=1220188 RepID=A0A4S3IYI6_9EURO|nr:hypothetical protein EYZ11_013104 [Aspergillus tanneri]